MVTKKGFTLIELLVVISIISILSSIALVSFNNARAEARDSFRIQTVQQVRNALELYYSDKQVYPIENNTCEQDNSCLLQQLKAAGYFSVDGSENLSLSIISGQYYSYNNAQSFILEVNLETRDNQCWYNDSRGVGFVSDNNTNTNAGCTYSS